MKICRFKHGKKHKTHSNLANKLVTLFKNKNVIEMSQEKFLKTIQAFLYRLVTLLYYFSDTLVTVLVTLLSLKESYRIKGY